MPLWTLGEFGATSLAVPGWCAGGFEGAGNRAITFDSGGGHGDGIVLVKNEQVFYMFCKVSLDARLSAGYESRVSFVHKRFETHGNMESVLVSEAAVLCLIPYAPQWYFQTLMLIEECV